MLISMNLGQLKTRKALFGSAPQTTTLIDALLDLRDCREELERLRAEVGAIDES
jgi:hypothetical protein